MTVSVEELQKRIDILDDKVFERIEEYKVPFREAVEIFASRNGLENSDSFPEISACESDWFPTHPGIATKQYDVYLGVWVQHVNLPVLISENKFSSEINMPLASEISPEDLIGNREKSLNGLGVGQLDARSVYCFEPPKSEKSLERYLESLKESSRPIICEFPPFMKIALMSDTFVNSNGEHIRGYWLTEFLDPNNSNYVKTAEMAWGIANGYGNSIGREIDIVKSGSYISQLSGNTRTVQCSEFTYIGGLMEGDE